MISFKDWGKNDLRVVKMAGYTRIRRASEVAKIVRSLQTLFSHLFIINGSESSLRLIPQDVANRLSGSKAREFIAALLPILRPGRSVEIAALRRLYQLFAMLNVEGNLRLELVDRLYTRLDLLPKELPRFPDKKVAEALFTEASCLVGRSPDAKLKNYLDRLRDHFEIHEKQNTHGGISQLLQWLTELENQIARLFSKEGHVVRGADVHKELFKKFFAYVGLPLAVIYPLGVVGLSSEGILTGLAALGSLGLATSGSVAAAPVVMGVILLAAISGTAKRLLDMALPTTDVDRLSAEIKHLMVTSEKLRRAYDKALGQEGNSDELKHVCAEALNLLESLVPEMERERRSYLERLKQRYLEMVFIDAQTLSAENHIAAADLIQLKELDEASLD